MSCPAVLVRLAKGIAVALFTLALAAVARAESAAPIVLDPALREAVRNAGDLDVSRISIALNNAVADASSDAGAAFLRPYAESAELKDRPIARGIVLRVLSHRLNRSGDLAGAEAATEASRAAFEAGGAVNGVARALSNAATLAMRREDVGKAAKIYMQAMQVNGGKLDPEVLLQLHHNTGLLYVSVHMYERALRHHLAAIDLAKTPEEPGTLYLHAALDYMNLGRQAEAEAMLAKSDRIIGQGKDRHVREGVALLRGILLTKLGRHEEAIRELQRLAQLTPGSATAYCALVEGYLALGRLPEADAAGRTCSEEAEAQERSDSHVTADHYRSKALFALGRHEEAAALAIGAMELHDATERRRLAQQSNVLAVEMDVAAERALVKLAEERRTHAEAAVAQQRRLLVAMIAAGVLLLALAALFALLWRQRVRTHQALAHTAARMERQAEDLARAVAQRETLLVELNHRVKNNLQIVASLLGLERRRSEAEGVENVGIRDVQARVLSMASIHEGLQDVEAGGEVRLDDFIERLTERLAGVYAHRCRFELEARSGARIEPAVAAPLSLILCELVSNVSKHAYPLDCEDALVRIRLERGDETSVLSVIDEGVGMPPHWTPAANGSLGLTLAYDLAEQIGARLTTRGNHPRGTEWRLFAPHAAPAPEPV